MDRYAQYHFISGKVLVRTITCTPKSCLELLFMNRRAQLLQIDLFQSPIERNTSATVKFALLCKAGYSVRKGG